MCALIVLSTHSTTQSLQSNAAAHQKQQHYYMSAWSMSRQRCWLMCRSKSGSERVENKWAGVIYVNIKCLTVLLMALVIAMLFRNSQRLACRMNFDYILFIVPLRANPDYFIDPPTFPLGPPWSSWIMGEMFSRWICCCQMWSYMSMIPKEELLSTAPESCYHGRRLLGLLCHFCINMRQYLNSSGRAQNKHHPPSKHH